MSGVDGAWLTLHSQIPTAVRAAERALAAGTGTEADLRAILEFHQDFVTPLCEAFANALPSENALAAIARWSPAGVVEIGAGGGLWARLLRARGVEVDAYDLETPTLPWSELWCGSERSLIAHPACSLLLCWPPLEDGVDGPNPMAFDALRSYCGDTLLYVGERPAAVGLLSTLSWRTAAGHTAGARFHAAVDAGWTLVEVVTLQRWPGFADALYVFRRRGKSEAPPPATAAKAAARDYDREFDDGSLPARLRRLVDLQIARPAVIAATILLSMQVVLET
jgi:hypothetical protein